MKRRNTIIETERYNAALRLIRSGNPSAAEVSRALGACDSDGPPGNIWSLLDARQAVARGDFTSLTEKTWKALHWNHVPVTLDLIHGIFIDDKGRTVPLSKNYVGAWLASMRDLPVDPWTRPVGPRVDVHMLLPDGKTASLLRREYMERHPHLAGVKLQPGAEFTLPPGTVIPPAGAPVQGATYDLDAEGERFIREAAAAPGPDDPRIVGFCERPNPEVETDDEAEAEKDDWGLSGQGASDFAHRYGCRVEISGKDDPAQPNTYYDDLRAYAVVTDRSTGRLVGLVECWDSEDGDPLVPRTWLKTILKAWRAKATPKRAA